MTVWRRFGRQSGMRIYCGKAARGSPVENALRCAAQSSGLRLIKPNHRRMLRHDDHPDAADSLQFCQPFDEQLGDFLPESHGVYPDVIAKKMLQSPWKSLHELILHKLRASSLGRWKLVEPMPQV